MTKKNKYLIAILCMLLSACSSDAVYNTMQDLPDEGWVIGAPLKFPLHIDDVTSPYSLYYSGRYDNNYPYYNIYISWTLYDSTGKVEIDKPAKPIGMDLFDPATGAPKGNGIGKEKDFLIKDENRDLKFPYSGDFVLEVKQYMRLDTLEGINAFGIRLDKKVATP